MSPAIGFARALREHPPLPELEYGWLEAPLEARLAFLRDLPDWCDAARWPAGRLFGEAGEYQWRTEPEGTLHAVLLLDAGEMPAALEPPLKLEPVDGDAELLLWGEWVRPESDREGNPDGGPRFYANEIPRIQEYPLVLDEHPAEGATPRLVVRTYRDAAGRRGEFARCVRLQLGPPEDDDA